ncbi:MAG: serine/threonine-protein kinase, partial [Planctomycetota bacterium]
MANSNNVTEQLIARAKLGEDAALVDLIGLIGPALRRAVNSEMAAVQHNLDAAQMWNEIQSEAQRRISEFRGTTEAEFAAWTERLALRHIRYSVGGRAGSGETIFNQPKTDTLAEPAASPNFDPNATLAPGSQQPTRFDPNATTEPDQGDAAKFDPNATLAPSNKEKAKFDPNATLGPGDGNTFAPNAFAIPKHDPHATITDLTAIPLAPQTTKIFGDYEILETIAKGGMGVVYKARQRKLNRIVALKMILAGQFADQEDIDRFYVEAEAAAQLRHPNIVGIFEVGECDGQHYFSMEYIEGQSLGDLVREHPLTPRAAAQFVKTISEAMYYAHQKGVLHRDLKPSNVLVDNDNEPLITDFGLAKRTEEQSVRTMAGSILGTPSYMPPEQAAGKLDLISERSDVYSIGAILYELTTGKPPFGAANPWETIKQVINNEPVSPRLLNNSVPADLETICLKCLQKDRARRYNTAQDLADELQRFLSGEPILARPIGVVERSVRWCYRNPWPTAALGVLLLGIMGTTVGLVQARVAQHQAELSRNQLLAAINELFTAWGDVTLLNEPGFEEVRAQLLATASNLYKKMGDQLGEDPTIQHELGVSYFRLGRMMFHLRSYEDAREAIESGLRIQRKLHAARPADEQRSHALGDSLNLEGELLLATAADIQGLEQAEVVYDEAIAKRHELVLAVADNREYEREWLNARMNQGMAWQRMADLLADANQLDRAASLDAKILARAEEVQQARIVLRDRLKGNSDVRREVVHDLAQGYYNMANITWWQGDFEATGAYVTSAVQAFDELRETNPGNLAYQYDQANCLALGGDAKAEQMRLIADQASPKRKSLHDEALASYKQAMVIFERLAANSTRVPKYRAAVA